jgi:hypothetical protein
MGIVNTRDDCKRILSPLSARFAAYHTNLMGMIDRLIVQQPKPYYSLCASGAIFTILLLAWTYYYHHYHLIKVVALVLLCTLAYDLILRARRDDEIGSMRYKLVLASLTLVCFMLPLIHLASVWKYGIGNFFCFGGLIPYSDASCYYDGARSLIEWGTLNDFSIRRPLGPCFYGMLLLLTGQNLQAAIVINALLVACSVYFPVAAMYRTCGAVAGLLMAFGLTGWIFFFIPTMLQEPISFVFANSAFGLLWNGFFYKRRVMVVLGIGVLGFAQAIRPGAIVALPVFALFAGYALRKHGRYAWNAMLMSMVAAAVPFFFSLAVIRVCNPDKVDNFNAQLSYTFYGLAKGGGGWFRLFNEHPEFLTGEYTQSHISTTARREGVQAFRDTPQLLFKSLAFSYWMFIRDGTYWFDVLVPFIREKVSVALTLLFMISVLIFGKGLGSCRGLLVLFFLSLIACMPVYVEVGDRVTTATMPFLCAFVAAGAGRLIHWSPGNGSPGGPLDRYHGKNRFLLVFSLIAVSLILFAPFIARHRNPQLYQSVRNLAASMQLDSAEFPIIFRASKGTFIHLTADSSNAGVPDVRRARWYHNGALDSAHCGEYVGNVLNLLDNQKCYYLILNEDPSKYNSGIVATACRSMQGSEPGHLVCRGKKLIVVQ